MLIALSMLLLAPAAHAGWSAAGAFEPSTAHDVADGRMFLTPDTSPSTTTLHKVYFNAFATEQPTSLDPNLGETQSRLELEPNVHYQAVLGVWKDCNRDGYVGWGDNALLEYRAELLPDASVCPAGTGTLVFNDGAWVTELLTLGQPDPCVWTSPPASYCSDAPGFRMDPRVLYVNNTAVWGDFGLPGGDPTADCPTAPLPWGTTSGTGYLLYYADCFDEHDLARDINTADAAVDPTNAQRLAFEDPNAPQRSSSQLNQQLPVNAYGNPTTGKAGLLQEDARDDAVTVFACAPGSTPDYEQLQLDPQHPTPTRTLAPALRDPTGSYWDSAVDLEEAVQGDCDPSTNNTLRANYAWVQLEGKTSGVDTSRGRARTNFVMTFEDAGQGTGVVTADQTLGTQDAPRDLGLAYVKNATGPVWTASASYALRGPQLARTDIMDPLAGASYTTFYARVSPSDISKYGLTLPPNAGIAFYGTEACGSSIAPGAQPRNGWVCDPTKWWRAPDGSDLRPYYEDGVTPVGQVVGAPYQLRDVDCVDGRVANWPSAAPPGLLPGDGLYASAAPESRAGTCQ